MEANLADLFEYAADTFPDREDLVSGPDRRTYAQMEVRANRLAHPQVPPGGIRRHLTGAPDERWGQTVAAVVQFRPGRSATLEDLQDHCRAHIAGYKAPPLAARADRPRSCGHRGSWRARAPNSRIRGRDLSPGRDRVRL